MPLGEGAAAIRRGRHGSHPPEARSVARLCATLATRRHGLWATRARLACSTGAASLPNRLDLLPHAWISIESFLESRSDGIKGRCETSSAAASGALPLALSLSATSQSPLDSNTPLPGFPGNDGAPQSRPACCSSHCSELPRFFSSSDTANDTAGVAAGGGASPSGRGTLRSFTPKTWAIPRRAC